MQNMEWYALLSKPALTPPDAVFGMVWPVLYVMIFVALAVYWKTKSEIKKTAGYVCFFIQLLMNLSWTTVFFSMQSPVAALILLAAMTVVAAKTVRLFFKVSKIAGGLMVPYGMWLLFALYLNAGIAVLN